MGTTSQGSRQANQAVEPAEGDSVSASISVLFRNRVPQSEGDDLDEGWDGDEEASSPSAVGVKLPAAALAPARVPAFISTSLAPFAASEWSGTPMSRTPAIPADDDEWDLPSTPDTESVSSSCVRELARSSSHESAGKCQLQCPSTDSSTSETLDSTASAVSAPAIDITIEPAFQAAAAEPKLSVESASSPDLTEVLSGPRSSRSPLARGSDRAASGRTRWGIVLATVVVAALGGAIYLAWHASSGAPFKVQDPAAAAPMLPHLAIPSPPALDVPSSAAKTIIEEPKEPKLVTGDSLDVPHASRPIIKPIARRRVRTAVPRQRLVEPAAPIAVIAEPANASSAAAPVGVVDNMIAAPAPQAAEPLQQAPTLRSSTVDEPLPSHLSK